MAESFVFDIADSLLGKLASYVCEEASRAYGVYEDLQGIKDTLSIVKGLLLDAEEKKKQQHALREWMRQIQNICSDAENVFDGFELEHKKKQVLEASSSTRLKVSHFLSSSNPLVFRCKMAHQIKEIKDRLDKVATDGTRFGLAATSVDPGFIPQRREMTFSHVDLDLLPKGLGKLISLRKLYISTKQSVLSLDEFASMSNLQTLYFRNCDNLEALLGEVQLASLEVLTFYRCGSLVSLPLCSFSKLEALQVTDCKRLQLRLPENPQSKTKRWRMKYLRLENFPELHTLPEWIERAAETLQTLIIINIPMLWKLPDCLTRMTHLKGLCIARCPLLDSFPSGMQHLTFLEALTIDGCPKLCRKCQPHYGEYWPMISHIKRVSIGEEEEKEEERVPQEGEMSNDDLLPYLSDEVEKEE